MGRRTKHFFEVFQNEELKAKAPTAPMRHITRAAPTPTPPLAVSRPQEPTPRPKPKSISLRLTRETAIVTGILFAGLLFLSHVWGYYRGASRRYESPASVAQAAEGASNEKPVYAGGTGSRALNVADSTRSSGPMFYSLCVWQGTKAAAERLKADLKQPNRPCYVLPLPDSQWYAVAVGEYESKNTEEAKALQREFQEKIYKGRKEFEKCYWVKVAMRSKRK